MLPPMSAPPDGDINRGANMLALFWAPYPFMFAIVAARLAVRFRMRNLGLDDWLMLAALVTYTAGSVPITIYMLKGGVRHMFYINPADLPLLVKLNFISQPFGACAALWGKMSVAFLVLRITGPNHKWQKLVIHISVAVYFAITIVYCILLFVQCNPPHALWDRTPSAKCWDPHKFTIVIIVQGAAGTFVDLVLAIIPTTIIWALALSFQTRLSLSFLLSLGAAAGIFSALKTVHMKNYADRADLTWATYPIFMWAIAEIILIVLFGSIPPLKPLFDRARKGKPIAPSGKSAGYQYGSRASAPTGKGMSGPGRSWRRGEVSLGGSTVAGPEESTGMRSESEVGLKGEQLHVMVQNSLEVRSVREGSFGSGSVERDGSREKVVETV